PLSVTTVLSLLLVFFYSFFSTTPPPPELYTLSLHDALPIFTTPSSPRREHRCRVASGNVSRSPERSSESPGSSSLTRRRAIWTRDRKSTRLNSSHVSISYAVFCLKKKKKKDNRRPNNTTCRI